MSAKVASILLLVCSSCIANTAMACDLIDPTRPKLQQILRSSSTVFIGTVVDSGGPQERLLVGTPPQEVIVRVPTTDRVKAKFKVEISIRGQVVKFFEVQNGGGGDCSYGFEVGQRWFFSGTASNGGPGSTVLIDQFGNQGPTGILGVDHKEIFKMFPDALKLPVPSRVVQDFLNEK